MLTEYNGDFLCLNDFIAPQRFYRVDTVGQKDFFMAQCNIENPIEIHPHIQCYILSHSLEIKNCHFAIQKALW